MNETDIFLRYGTALIIGMLVGMQRQFSTGREGEELSAGVRTIALIGLMGCASAHISHLSGSPWPLAACIAVLGALLTAVHFVEAGRRPMGLTTQAAALITFLAGVLTYHNRLALAGSLGVVTTALLSLKPELHGLARRLTREDILSFLKFAIISVVFLPLLPDRSYFAPPFDRLNPFEIGLFVVLISGVGFIGYVLAKIMGSEKGIGLIGLVGGLVSSTAVTLGFTQRSRSETALSASFALGIFASWVVMFLRTLVLVTVLDAQVGRRLWMPLGAAAAVAAAYALFLLRRGPAGMDGNQPPFANPFELGPALRFGLLFVAIVTGARTAQVYFGDMGTYLSGFAAGLVDVDAVSYSMTRVDHGEGWEPAVASAAILLAALANTLLKGGFAVAAGSPELRRRMLPGLVLTVAAGAAGALLP